MRHVRGLHQVGSVVVSFSKPQLSAASIVGVFPEDGIAQVVDPGDFLAIEANRIDVVVVDYVEKFSLLMKSSRVCQYSIVIWGESVEFVSCNTQRERAVRLDFHLRNG
jgi:hypothetical protein